MLGRWPTWVELDDELDRGAGIEEPWQAVNIVDRSLLWGVGDREPADGQEVGLTVAGLRKVPAAAEDLRVLAEAVRWAVSAARDAPTGADVSITGDTVAHQVALSGDERDQLLQRQKALWDCIGGLWTSRSSGSGAHNWKVELDRKQLRRLRRATTASEILERLAQPLIIPSGPATAAPLEDVSPVGAASEPGVDSEAASPQDPRDVGQVAANLGLNSSSRRPFGLAVEAAAPSRVSTALASVTAEDGTVYEVDYSTVLGEGTYGRVHAALGPGGEAVAVKVVHVRAGAGTEAWYRDTRAAMREAIVGAYVDARGAHGVIPLLGHVLTDQALVLFFARAEYSLETVVAARRAQTSVPTAAGGGGGVVPPSDGEVRGIAVELAGALDQLHMRGVMHRDIKPGNALRWNGRWCWSDLGIARVLDHQTETFTFALGGTRAYTAPEVITQSEQTLRSDVYSLGCTLYELATGTVPFSDSPARGHVTELADFDAVTDPVLRRALTYALSKSPGARPTAQQLVDMLTGPAATTDESAHASFRNLAALGRRREDERTALGGQVARRAQASADAMAQFRRVWDDFIEVAHEMDSDARGGHEDDTRSWMRLYDDQIYALRTSPADGATHLTAVGVISMQHANESSRSVVNVYADMRPRGSAAGDGDGDVSRWYLVKLQPN